MQTIKMTSKRLFDSFGISDLFTLAEIFAKLGGKKHLKQLILFLAYDLFSAYLMCGLLALFYPENATLLVQVLTGEIELPEKFN